MSSGCSETLSEEPRVFPAWMLGNEQKRYLKFKGVPNVLCTEEEVNAVCDKLNTEAEVEEKIVGFDCEWDVCFSRGTSVQQKVALIQICVSKNECYLFRLSSLNYCMPDKLKILIKNHRIIKVGVNVDGDIYKLHRDYEVESDSIVSGEKRSTIELSEFANDVFGKSEHWSLQGLTEFLVGCSLRKDTSVRISKWSSEVLSMQQIDYAACDAFASLLVFHKINNHKERMLQPSVFLQAE